MNHLLTVILSRRDGEGSQVTMIEILRCAQDDGGTIPVRYIFIGDIHGCFEELSDLLERVAPASSDIVVSVGDMVRKGPAPDRCLDLWRERRYLAVRGNQEEKLLQLIDRRDVRDAPDRAVESRPKLVAQLRSFPLFLDFSDAGLATVHGGVLPGTKINVRSIDAQRKTVTTLRYVRRTEHGWVAVPKNQQKDGDRFWSELWDGNRTVMYGHTPGSAVRRDAKAIGLDTACVYGDKLTAAVYENGSFSFVSVPARRRYASPSIIGRVRKWLAS